MPDSVAYELSAHAETVMAEREILEAWVARVLNHPERSETDITDPLLRHALGRVAERDDRVLRVIYNETVEPWRVVTAFFDRAMRGKL